MLQLRSIVGVADNSGAKKVGVFKVLGGTRHRYAEIGDIVVVSVKVAEPRKAVKKKDVLRAVVVRQRKPFRRKDGTYIKFDENAVVILDGKEPKGGYTGAGRRNMSTIISRPLSFFGVQIVTQFPFNMSTHLFDYSVYLLICRVFFH